MAANVIFSGIFEHTLDDKGRVAVPSKLKKLSEDSVLTKLIITRGPENCIYCYSESKWDEIVSILRSKIETLPFGNASDRAFFRLFVGQAFSCQIDKLGRIAIPDTLIETAGISQNVIFVGNIDHIEIWDRKKWAQYFSENSGKFESYLNEMTYGRKKDVGTESGV